MIRLNIRGKLLFFSAAIILFVIVVICLVNYSVSITKVNEDMLNLSASLTASRLVNFENMVVELNRNIFNILNNTPLTDYLKEANKPRSNVILSNLQIEPALKNIVYSNTMIDSLLLVDLNGRAYYAAKNKIRGYAVQLDSLLSHRNRLPETKGQYLWHMEKERIFIEKLLYNSSYVELVGLYSIEINKKYLARQYHTDLSGNTYTALIDNGFFLTNDVEHRELLKYVSDTMGFGFGQDLDYGGIPYKVNIAGSGKDRRVVDVIPLDKLTESRNITIVINLLIGVAVFFAAFVVNLYISSGFSGNINKLLRRINLISQGDFYSDVQIGSGDELDVLGVRLNELGREMDRLIRESVREQQIRQEMEYKMLESQYYAIQSRINPHFVYNFLESISSLAILKGLPEVSDVICEFANLFRANVKRLDKYVTLKEEFDYLKSYVKLYKHIYPKKITAVFYLDPLLRKIIVPGFILLPLVENVIVHKVEHSIQKIRMEVTCRIEGEFIIMEVRNDGGGMEESYLRGLVTEINNFQNSHREDKKHAGVGLRSINRIIKLRYGEEYGLEVESSPASGTVIKIRIPLKE